MSGGNVKPAKTGRNQISISLEKYLDALDLSARIHVTKIRLSSHRLPVEVLRYNKNYPDRKDRTCNICESNVLGDENHFLLHCKNRRMADVRSSFFESIKMICPQLKKFNDENIVKYCLCMKDQQIQEPTSSFVKKLYETYRGEERVPPLKILCLRRLGMLRK